MKTNTLEDAVADDSHTLINEMACPIAYEAITKACDGENYTMSLVDDDEIMEVVAVVNQGIDSRLQACNCPHRGDSFKGGERSFIALEDTLNWKKGDKVIYQRMLECCFSPESLPVFLRRMFEADPCNSLAASILYSLGFSDTGKFIGREACGLE